MLALDGSSAVWGGEKLRRQGLAGVGRPLSDFVHRAYLLYHMVPPSCSASLQVHRHGTSHAWTQTSEAMSSNQSSLL